MLSTVWPFRMCFFSQFGACRAKNVYATRKRLFTRKSTKRSLPSRPKQRQWYHSTRLNEFYKAACNFIMQASMVFCFWKNCPTTIFLKNPFTICLFTVMATNAAAESFLNSSVELRSNKVYKAIRRRVPLVRYLHYIVPLQTLGRKERKNRMKMI